MNKALICPVAYNENVKLKSVIERYLKSPVFGKTDYLVVDDASDDGTSEMIAGFAAQGVKTIRHEKRSGVGAAIRTAIYYAKEKGYEVLVIMAGNNKDNPDEIPRLLDRIFKENYDFVQGSRYLHPASIGGDMPFYRKISTRLYPFILSVLTKTKVTDATNGFRAFRLSLLKDKNIDITQDWLNQYELEPYLLYKTIVLGYRYAEAPVTKIYPPKKLGYTKMKPFSGWWSIFRPMVYLALGIKK